MEYFVEYFAEKKDTFYEKKVLFWKKNDMEKPGKINDLWFYRAFWNKQTTGIEPVTVSSDLRGIHALLCTDQLYVEHGNDCTYGSDLCIHCEPYGS